MVDDFHFGDSNTDNVNFSNCIFWDIGTASTASTANSPNTTYINVTVGDVNAQNTENTFTDRSSTDLVYFNNSIFYDIEGTGTESCPYRCSRILSLADESSNNLFYDYPNLTVGDTTDIIIGVDPQMTHPVRITPGSNAHTNVVGATVIKRRGSSGTLWGEAGYDEILNDSLWPWPNEYQIKGEDGRV
ncbi:MAG: hypothetical protein SVJ22_08960 [Halobacteriota archaeon]|nr:hypothetical protein [Halobacteriota archaeon]